MPSKTPLFIPFFKSMPILPTLSFGSLGYKVIRPSYFIFLAFSSSKDKTIVYSVNRIVIDKEVDEEVDKEVDNKAVKQRAFKRMLFAKKLGIGLNKL